jgi:hypothetical protein
MKIKLTENQYGGLIQKQIEEDYPTTWDENDFKSLNTFKDRVRYCEDNLIRISSGSGRIVYKIDETKVLKLAKNNKGIAQNNVEIDFSNDHMWNGLIPEVYDYDEDGKWIETELARKLTQKKFKELTGLYFNNFCDGLRYYEQDLKPSKMFKISEPKNYQELWDNEFVGEIFSIVGNYQLPVDDLCRLSTYGLVQENGEDKIVMIDYGLTQEVYDSYYS